MNFTNLIRFLDSLPEMGIPGVDMAIYQHHKPVFRYGAGFRDRENRIPVSGDETYFAYSCTKPMTATCALMLFEKGEFLLSDPLYEYMPEFKNMTVAETDAQGNVRMRPARRDIRIRDLFTMSAGFNYTLRSPETLKVLEETGGLAPTRAVVAALSKIPLSFDPGEHWQYSLCHDVLAALVETVSGMRFETYMTKNLFEPLGMTMSSLHLTPAQEKKLASQYRRDEKNNVHRIGNECGYILGPSYDSGGAGLITCVNDYIRFADALACGGVGATGERILTRPTIELMRLNCLNAAQMKDFNWPQMIGYGYGLGVRTMIDRTQGALSPVGEFGWGGAAGAYVLIDCEHELSAYFAEHMLNSYEPFVHPRLRNLIYSCMESD